MQTVDEIMKDSERVIAQYHDRSFGAMHRVALAPCSPFSVSADLLRESAVLARQLGVRLHTHLCETKDEENFMLAREGVRPLEYMERLGWTGDDVGSPTASTSTTRSCASSPRPARACATAPFPT